MKQGISMPLFLLSLAFLFISNCAPYFLFTQRQEIYSTVALLFRDFPQCLFLLIPCVAVDMLGHSLLKPFWWTGDVVLGKQVLLFKHIWDFCPGMIPLGNHKKQWTCTDVGFVIDERHSLGTICMVREDPGSGSFERLGFISASAPSAPSDFEQIIMSPFCTWNNYT